MLNAGRNRRAAVLGVIYAAVAAVSFYVAFEVRFDFFVEPEFQAERLRMLPFAIAIKLIALVFAKQLGTLLTYFSVPDFLRLLWAMLAASAALMTLRAFGANGVPRGVILVDFMLCTGALCAARLGTRLFRERVSGHSGKEVVQQQRIAIIGAGDAGASLAKEFLSHPSRGFKPVAFFDDDLTKQGRLVHGLPVIGPAEMIGTTKDLSTLAKVIIAMPSAPAKRVRQIVRFMTEQGLKVETLPSMTDLAAGRVHTSRVRPVEVQDLLGREMVDLDSEGIRKSIQGRVVLVTGAGGSIGSELCRQIAALAPKQLLLVEQAEGALFLIEQELNELGLGSLGVPLVGDILDEERIDYIFGHYQPQVVFHAAAHKHVYLMERQPAEAIRNNVLGTRRLAEMAVKHGVAEFVFISTDKAINPTNVMGATKRLAEIQLMAIAAAQPEGRRTGGPEGQMAEVTHHAAEVILRAVAGTTGKTLEAAAQPVVVKQIGFHAAPEAQKAGGPEGQMARGPESQKARGPEGQKTGGAVLLRSSGLPVRTKFMAVRFGNVLGSSGSVIPIFKRQIANGGPITVTHPDVTRYFMTIPEAVGLVLQASIQGKGGEIFVLDMGQPVKIVDLARQMIELSGFKVGEDIEIKFTGLKPGEKLYEELQHKNELYTKTDHPRIMRFTSTAAFSEAGVQELQQRLYELEPNQLKQLLKRLVPEYTPFLN